MPRELYPAFQEVLLVALAEFHGKDWNDGLSRQWREATANAVQFVLERYDHPAHV